MISSLQYRESRLLYSAMASFRYFSLIFPTVISVIFTLFSFFSFTPMLHLRNDVFQYRNLFQNQYQYHTDSIDHKRHNKPPPPGLHTEARRILEDTENDHMHQIDTKSGSGKSSDNPADLRSIFQLVPWSVFRRYKDSDSQKDRRKFHVSPESLIQSGAF